MDNTPPRCATCDGAHGPLVRCDGTPIDWQARRERARAYTARWMATKPHERERMEYRYEDEHDHNAPRKST